MSFLAFVLEAQRPSDYLYQTVMQRQLSNQARKYLGVARKVMEIAGVLIRAKLGSCLPIKFELRNPAWPQLVNEILQKIPLGMGISGGGVTTELHSLTLHQWRA
jgi:hypothetical protein